MVGNLVGTEIGKFEILKQRRDGYNVYLYCKCKKCGREKWYLKGRVKHIKCCESKRNKVDEKQLAEKFDVLDKKTKENQTYLYCKCKKCGKERWYTKGYASKAICCGCKNNKIKEIDYTGQIINNVLLIEKISKNMNVRDEKNTKGYSKTSFWKCKCECGNIFYAPLLRIQNGEIQNCGCKSNKSKDDIEDVNLTETKNLRYNKKDLKGKRFGRVVVLEETNKRENNGSIIWKCMCDCGNIIEVSSRRLVNSINVSCGCYQKERQKYSMSKLQRRQSKDGTNIDLITKKEANSNNKTSGVRGVHYCKSKKSWIATLNFQKKLVLNKAFKEKEDAIKARKEAEEIYFKTFLEDKKKTRNVDCNEIIRRSYKEYMKDVTNKSKIIIDYNVFNKYLKENTDKGKIKKLANMLIKKFENNNYIVYRENETYVENTIDKKVRKGTAVAMRK